MVGLLHTVTLALLGLLPSGFHATLPTDIAPSGSFSLDSSVVPAVISFGIAAVVAVVIVVVIKRRRH